MYLFIVNPHSRSGLGKTIWHQIEPILGAKGVSYQVYFTKYQRHATKITQEITSDLSEHILVVLGGDGTVNETINGICDFDKVTLGYIPTGSSNDFARSLGLPCEPAAALQNILNPTYMSKMDIGLLTCPRKKKLFAVSAGIGFDAAVCHQAVVSKLKFFLNRLRLGKLTYAGIALNRIIHATPCRFTLMLDGGPPKVFEKSYFAAIMNHPYEGGGFKFCPSAKTNDRKLDVIVIAGVSKLMILLLLPTAFFGKHTISNKVHLFQCKSVTIQTEHALPVHTDGEPIFLQKEISASVASGQLCVITSKP